MRARCEALLGALPEGRGGESAPEGQAITPVIMSICATLWHLQFPHQGDAHVGCEWVDVLDRGPLAFPSRIVDA